MQCFYQFLIGWTFSYVDITQETITIHASFCKEFSSKPSSFKFHLSLIYIDYIEPLTTWIAHNSRECQCSEWNQLPNSGFLAVIKIFEIRKIP